MQSYNESHISKEKLKSLLSTSISKKRLGEYLVCSPWKLNKLMRKYQKELDEVAFIIELNTSSVVSKHVRLTIGKALDQFILTNLDIDEAEAEYLAGLMKKKLHSLRKMKKAADRLKASIGVLKKKHSQKWTAKKMKILRKLQWPKQ